MDKNMKFTIKGTFKDKKGTVNFSKEILANNEENAKTKLFAELGSKHHLKRRFIEIKEVTK